MVKIRVREAPWLSLRSNKNLNPNPHANRLSRPSHYLLQHPHTKVWRAATRAREAQLSLATFSRSRPSVMAKPGETGDASAVGVPGPAREARCLIARPCLRVCVNPACARTSNTSSFCCPATLSSLLVGTLAVVNARFPRTEIFGSRM